MKKNDENLPGCIYLNHGRYYWRVRLPGEEKYSSRPLKPVGVKFATRDLAVARQVARDLLRKLTFKTSTPDKFDGTITNLVQLYTAHANQRYRDHLGNPTSEAANVRSAVAHLLDSFAMTQAADFGPLKLKEVRRKMISSRLARGVINQRINVIRRMFRWAASDELIPAETWHSLLTVEGLRRGMPGVTETKPILPVDETIVQATLPFLSPVVADMVRIQQLTGMRSGELVIMRPMDIERSTDSAKSRSLDVWLYRPASHKTAYRGLARAIALGPKAQEIIQKYLDRPTGACLFSPAEADSQRRKAQHEKRRTPTSQGNAPGTNVKENPIKKPGDEYSPQSYARSISYACKAAKVPHWHPHQIRHAAATRLRQAFEKKGLDVARAVLGHRSLGMADHYAELDLALAIEAAKKIG